MFTFALAFFADHQYFSLHFQPLSAFRGKKKKEFATSIHNKNHWPQLLHVSGVDCQIDRFACFAAFFSSFPKEDVFQSLEENLWTINRKTEFPDFSLTLTISKIFTDLKEGITSKISSEIPYTLLHMISFLLFFTPMGGQKLAISPVKI